MSDSERSGEQRRQPRRRRRSRRPAGPGAAAQNPRPDQGGQSRGGQTASGSAGPSDHSGAEAPSGGGGRGHRRRGGRGRGGRRGSTTTRATEGHSTTPQVRPADAESRPSSSQSGSSAQGRPKGGGQQSKGSGSHGGKGGGGKSGGRNPQKTASKGGARGRGRGAGGASRAGRQPNRLRTVRETSAGGLVVRGLADAVVDGTREGTGGHHAVADGVVLDLTRLDVALIGRLDRRGRMLWSMPKGHIEPGETVEQTARREVVEETGADGTVLSPLGSIDYWFVADGKRIHKTVHHHLIRYDTGELCDEDPEITEVAWVPFVDLPDRLTYPDERKLVDTARRLLPALARDERDGTTPAPLPALVVDPARRSDTQDGARDDGDDSGTISEVTGS